MSVAAVKVTDLEMRTSGGKQWALGECEESSGEGGLKGPGWLHWYSTMELAGFFTCFRDDFLRGGCRFFIGEADGEIREGLVKSCSTRLVLSREVAPVVPSVEQYVVFGLLCAGESRGADERWLSWRDRWLSGKDVSLSSAETALVFCSGAAYTATRAAIGFLGGQCRGNYRTLALDAVWGASRSGLGFERGKELACAALYS